MFNTCAVCGSSSVVHLDDSTDWVVCRSCGAEGPTSKVYTDLDLKAYVTI